MDYLMTNSTHFIYGYMASNIIMVNNYLHNESIKRFPHFMGFSRISSEGFFYKHHHIRIVHTTAFVKTVLEHWLDREITKWIQYEGSIRELIAP